MKQLLLIPLVLFTFATTYGQGEGSKNKAEIDPDETEVIYHNKDGVVISVEQKPAVRDTLVISYKGITYGQSRIEMFNEVELDTMYMIQYAIVSEVTSMPMHSVAVPFFTDQQYMHMIISDRYYANYSEAIAIGEKVRDENAIFELYIVKPCVLPKASAMVQRRNKNEQGAYRIQYTWTTAYPEEVLDGFTVESYNSGFRQVSERAFDTKPQAVAWLKGKSLPLNNFWVYPLEKANSRMSPDKSVSDHVRTNSSSPEVGKNTSTKKN